MNRDRQVYVSFDGKSGLIIQTSASDYERFYKLLGWELMGSAAELPLFKERDGSQDAER